MKKWTPRSRRGSQGEFRSPRSTRERETVNDRRLLAVSRSRGGGRRICSRLPPKTPPPPRRTAPCGGGDKSGNNLLSRCSHYHRPELLNGRVRNAFDCQLHQLRPA